MVSIIVVLLLIIIGFASPFSSFSSLSVSTKSSNVELSALPKWEVKENPFKVPFLNYKRLLEVDVEEEMQDKIMNRASDLEEKVHDDIMNHVSDFEVELLRQKLEYEAMNTLDNFDTSPLITEFVPSDTTTVDTSTEPSQFLSSVWQARLLLLASAALYGTNFTFVKILNDNMPCQVATSLRFSLAAIATMPWLFQGDQSQQVKQDQSIVNGAILGGIEVGLWNTIGYISQAIGLETTPASTSAFICSLAVVTVPILNFASGKKILPREISGALLAIMGIAFLEMDGLQVGTSFQLSSGELYSLVQPLAFGVGFWRMEHYMRKFPAGAMQLTASQLAIIGVSSVMSFLITSGGDIPDISQLSTWLSTPTIIGAICWTGLITTALTVYMETLALKTLSAAETTMIFSTEPIFAAAAASIFLGESFGTGGYIGAALVLSGCLFSNISPEVFQKKFVDKDMHI